MTFSVGLCVDVSPPGALLLLFSSLFQLSSRLCLLPPSSASPQGAGGSAVAMGERSSPGSGWLQGWMVPFPRNRFPQRESAIAFFPEGVFPGEAKARSILNVRKLLLRAHPSAGTVRCPRGFYPSQLLPAMQRGFGIPRKHPTSKSNEHPPATWHLHQEITDHGLPARSHSPRTPSPGTHPQHRA